MANVPVSYQLPVGSFLLYPPFDVLSANPPSNVYPLGPQPPGRVFSTMLDVIRYYTATSLFCEGFKTILPASFSVTGSDTAQDPVLISMEADSSEQSDLNAFGLVHQTFLMAGVKAQNGITMMQGTAAWNPMAGYPVNKHDGTCMWSLYLPLGMAMLRQKAVVLMHYPPRVAMVHADYLHNNTLTRWQSLLLSCGATAAFHQYTTIIDVNPIAAPGSGQSEYPNDYFPIMMSSLFFDNAAASADYIRGMALTLLNPYQQPGPTSTLPLMVCGSPDYDPQAPGWFRVAYKGQMPKDPTGIPQANVLQTGGVVLPASGQGPTTPYLLANHMIAAGVEGQNTGQDWANSALLPDIRQYEAQDLASTTALLYMGSGMSPADARNAGCLRWYGTTDVPSPPGTPHTQPASPIPLPPNQTDRLLLCALGLVDLYFNEKTALPWYTFEDAKMLVARAMERIGPSTMPPPPEYPYPIVFNPCNTTVYPPPTGAARLTRKTLERATR